ncbi:MAG: AAA family ATPase [Desulfobacterales bacterium]|nr:AAA family ATPase [Desulfobacterales bacterium]
MPTPRPARRRRDCVGAECTSTSTSSTHKPFQITTDPKFLWLGEKHTEALATLKYGILEDKGFLLLTGDVGTGKTALIKLLVKTIDVAAIVATIPDPGLEPIDFFNFLAEEFKMDRRFASKGDFLIEFKQFLLKAYSTQTESAADHRRGPAPHIRNARADPAAVQHRARKPQADQHLLRRPDGIQPHAARRAQQGGAAAHHGAATTSSR